MTDDFDDQAIEGAETILSQAQADREEVAAALADLVLPLLPAEALVLATRKMTDQQRWLMTEWWVSAGYPKPKLWRDDE